MRTRKKNVTKLITFYRVYRISLSGDNSGSCGNGNCASTGRGGFTNCNWSFRSESSSSVSCSSCDDRIALDRWTVEYLVLPYRLDIRTKWTSTNAYWLIYRIHSYTCPRIPTIQIYPKANQSSTMLLILSMFHCVSHLIGWTQINNIENP